MHRRLLGSLLLASVVLNVMYGAIAGILVPAQVARADPAGKEASLAVIMAASSALTLVVRPLVGAATDRTSGRWGRRTPWLLGGAAATALALLGLGQATTVLAIGLGWVVVQPMLNVVEVPLDTVVADRFEAPQRPRASAVYGGGAAVGVALGAGIAGLFVARADVLYPLLSVLLVATMVGFAVRNPEGPAASTGRSGMSVRRAWAEPNVQYVFAGRLVLVLGHQLVLSYLLYIVIEFTHSSVERAAGQVSLLLGAHLVCVALGAWLVARLVGRHRRGWILGSTVVIAAGLLLLWALPDLVGLGLYAIIAGFGRGAYLTADLALMIDVLPSSADYGRDVGLLGLATILPQTLAPAVAGLVLTATGQDYRLLVLWAALGVLCSLALIARVRLVRHAGAQPSRS